MGEFHPGQMELNLRYGPALDAADRAFICKEMTRELAARKGYWITYMGRPMAHLVGSGLHINLSLTPVHGGANAFDDPTAEHGLSTLARQCIGGVIAHHEGMAAMSAPLVNSYKRLIPGIIAGYWANWGLDNRISTYRIPCERGAATRIENRMPCGSANPYLAAAVMLNAALLGVVDGRRLRRPADRRRRHRAEHRPPHAAHLGDALAALEADTVLCEAMGADLVKAFLTIRKDELAKWEAADGTLGRRDHLAVGARAVPAVLLGSSARVHMGYHMVMARREVLVQLDDDLVDHLDRLAKTLGTNRSELLRRGAQAVIDAEDILSLTATSSRHIGDSQQSPRSCDPRHGSLPARRRGGSQRDLLGRPRAAGRSTSRLCDHS